ncbi:MAG: hypothetical protein HZC25_10365 [Rhodospirillales bacterium]|nr:hypothetical protein [Rhodospirillales bacterium]
MPAKPFALTKRSLAFLTAISSASCASPPPDCAWVKTIHVDPLDRLVRATQEQIVAHNRKVAGFCR